MPTFIARSAMTASWSRPCRPNSGQRSSSSGLPRITSPETSMLTLYEHPLSPYAQKCKIALLEKGIPFEAKLPDAFGSGVAGGDFVAENPRHEVPLLVDGDVRIFDSTVILEYLEDKWPAPPMLPASPAERARVR